MDFLVVYGQALDPSPLSIWFDSYVCNECDPHARLTLDLPNNFWSFLAIADVPSPNELVPENPCRHFWMRAIRAEDSGSQHRRFSFQFVENEDSGDPRSLPGRASVDAI